MKNKYYTSRDPIKNYFPLPNEVFALGLSPGALAVYSYLMYIEDRTTYQCHASYKTIGKAVNMSPNTVRKYVTELVERGLIQDGAHKRSSRRMVASKTGAFCTRSCPFSSPSSSFTSKSLQSWTRNVSRNASESGWKRSNRRSRKPPVHPREPRVAAVSGFPGTAGRVPTGSPKPDVAPPCGSVNRKCSTIGQHTAVRSKEPKCGNRGKHRNGQNQRDFGRCGEKAG